MKPKIRLFNEPTSALDPEMIKAVLDVLLDLAWSEMTLLVMTHEMGFAREEAGRLVFMDTGEIVEAATPDTFFGNPETNRAKLFQEQIPDTSLPRLHRLEPGLATLAMSGFRVRDEGATTHPPKPRPADLGDP